MLRPMLGAPYGGLLGFIPRLQFSGFDQQFLNKCPSFPQYSQLPRLRVGHFGLGLRLLDVVRVNRPC